MLTHPPSLHTHLKPEPHWVQPAFRPSLGPPIPLPFSGLPGRPQPMGASSLGPWGKPSANRRGMGLAGGRSPGLAAGQSPKSFSLSCLHSHSPSTVPLLAAPLPRHLSKPGLSSRSLGWRSRACPEQVSRGCERKWCWVTKCYYLGVRAGAWEASQGRTRPQEEGPG